jgi:hypothetical protein
MQRQTSGQSKGHVCLRETLLSMAACKSCQDCNACLDPFRVLEALVSTLTEGKQ